jgi:hypothetical protein
LRISLPLVFFFCDAWTAVGVFPFCFCLTCLSFQSALITGAISDENGSSSSSSSSSSSRAGAVLHLGHSGGIGNKLVAVASTLLIALLSNRTAVSLLPQVLLKMMRVVFEGFVLVLLLTVTMTAVMCGT